MALRAADCESGRRAGRWPPLVVFGLVFGPWGCAPKVIKFEVTPSHACSGTPVRLEMRVVGTPTITTDPSLAEQAPHQYVPTTTTHFVVSVRRWPGKPAGSETEVKVMPGEPGEPDEITANVNCQADNLAGTVARPAHDWDPRLRVTTVESGEDREVLVSHEGRSARLTPDSPSTNAFDGTSPGGDWILSSPLRSGERCGASPPPPNLLNISAQVRCGS